MAEKTYKTYRQLLTLLRSRGMIIGKGSQGSRVMRILESENYYNVINGYKELFIAAPATATTDEKYKNGTTFDEVYAMYLFDREIRNIYLKYLLKVENQFKTVIAHEFSGQYGHDNYLKLNYFETTTEKDIASTTKLFGDIQQEISRQLNKHHKVVTHYMTEHGYIPLWVLVNVLTFGKITNFYKNMKQPDRVAVAKQFGLPDLELHKFMEMLGLARNKCAHDERFYDISFRKAIHTKSINNFSKLGITRAPDGSYKYGINDAYSIAIMFALLLSKTDINEFVSSMKSAFSKLQKQLHTISVHDVMQIMGFDSTWDNLPLLK